MYVCKDKLQVFWSYRLVTEDLHSSLFGRLELLLFCKQSDLVVNVRVSQSALIQIQLHSLVSTAQAPRACLVA